MDVEVLRIGREAIGDGLNLVAGEAGFDFVLGLPRSAFERRPVLGETRKMRHLLHRGGSLLRFGEFRLQLAHATGDIDAKLPRVELGERRMALDAAVAEWLRDGGVVDFGVSVTPIADEV